MRAYSGSIDLAWVAAVCPQPHLAARLHHHWMLGVEVVTSQTSASTPSEHLSTVPWSHNKVILLLRRKSTQLKLKRDCTCAKRRGMV